MPKESNIEFKVGMFVFLAMLVLAFAVFSISDSKSLKNGMTLRVIFNFADGLRGSAPVRIAGVEEGIVKDIKIFFDRQDSKTKAEVLVMVNRDAKIPADSTIVINQLGLLGEKYIEVFPGIDTRNFFQNEQTIVGKDPIPQAMISEKIMQVAGKLESTIGGISEIINSDKNQESISKTLENLSFLSGNLNTIAANIRDGKGTLGKFVSDDAVYQDVQAFAADLKANPWKLLYRPKK